MILFNQFGKIICNNFSDCCNTTIITARIGVDACYIPARADVANHDQLARAQHEYVDILGPCEYFILSLRRPAALLPRLRHFLYEAHREIIGIPSGDYPLSEAGVAALWHDIASAHPKHPSASTCQIGPVQLCCRRR